MIRISAVCASLLLTMLSIGALPAEAQPERWTLRASLLVTDYQKHLVNGNFLGRTELDLDGGVGPEIAAEYRPNRLIGWELSLTRLSLNADRRDIAYRVISFDPFVLREEVQSHKHGDFRIKPIAVSLLFHPLRGRRLDLYVGPQIAWVLYNADIDGMPDRDPEPGFGGKLGAELRLSEGSPWSLALELRHLQIPHEPIDHDIYTDIGIQTAALVVGYHVGTPRTP